MVKKGKKISIFILSGLLIFLIAGLGIQFYATKKIKKVLSEKLPPHIHITYEKLNLNLFLGKAQLNNFSLKIHNREAEIHTSLKGENLVLEGMSYWKYFRKDTLQFDTFSIDMPEVKHYPYLTETKSDTLPNSPKPFPSIQINTLKLIDGKISVIQDSLDSLKLGVNGINLAIEHVQVNNQTLLDKVPFGYDTIDLSLEELFLDIGKFETLQADKLNLKDKRLAINNFSINSKYDKKELSKKITIERDHISFETDSIVLHQLEYGFREKRFFVSLDSLELIQPVLAVYRDKRLPDDTKPKPLYSAMIRNLPFDIDIPKLAIHGGKIDYEELPEQGGTPGHIEFDTMEASIQNISNVGSKDKITEIDIHTVFMNHAEFHMNWTFNIFKESDEFLVLGSLKDFDTKSVNAFLTSGLRSQVEGRIQELYFTINGNKISSQGDMKMRYSNLSFTVLDKDRKGVNKFLSTLGNLFVSSDSKKGTETGYRYGEIKAERAQDKSFFNYLWLNVSDGVLRILTGSGKKKN